MRIISGLITSILCLVVSLIGLRVYDVQNEFFLFFNLFAVPITILIITIPFTLIAKKYTMSFIMNKVLSMIVVGLLNSIIVAMILALSYIDIAGIEKTHFYALVLAGLPISLFSSFCYLFFYHVLRR
ncbi:MAG: hypothetical protein ACI35O_10140 [Bacillaceae bacterium]